MTPLIQKEHMSKKVALFGVLSFLYIILFSVGHTWAWISDVEEVNDNVWNAGAVDFYLSETSFTDTLGVEVDAEIKTSFAILTEAGSEQVAYKTAVEQTGGDADFCNALTLIAKHNGSQVYVGDLFSFEQATTTEISGAGVWEFEIDAPATPGNWSHGNSCQFDFVYSGWGNSSPNGFTDEERFSVDVTARMIVLNEVLPDPTGADDALMPAGEWVELYNNGDIDIDVAGWKIQDADGGFWIATPTNSDNDGDTLDAGETIVPSRGYLVVYRNGAAMTINNTGDETVTLLDGSDVLVDELVFDSDTKGEGFSWARIPDGIGVWIDPIPTPVGANKLEEDDDESLLLLMQQNENVDSSIGTTSTTTLENLFTENGTSTNSIGSDDLIANTSTTSSAVIPIPEPIATSTASTTVTENEDAEEDVGATTSTTPVSEEIIEDEIHPDDNIDTTEPAETESYATDGTEGNIGTGSREGENSVESEDISVEPAIVPDEIEELEQGNDDNESSNPPPAANDNEQIN